MAAWLLIYYAIAITLIVSGGAAGFLLTRGRHPIQRALISLSILAAMALLWPIPTHGGLNFIGEILVREIWKLRDGPLEKPEQNAQIEFNSRLNQRFAGPLEVQGQFRRENRWQLVILGGDHRTWFDPSSGLIWGESHWLAGSSTSPGIEAAKRFCAEYSPAGYWALPTEAEQALMWQAAGRFGLPGSEFSEISYIVDDSLRMELPVFRVHGHQNDANSPAPATSIRCVARGPGAPDGGYTRRDIPLEIWNRYQLSKVNSG